MQIETVFHVVAKIPSPVLTLYINTSSQDATRHPRVRPELTWLLDAAETLRHNLPHREGKLFERQVKRVRRFLDQRRPAERALVIFASNKSWRVIPLHVHLKNGLYWGKPKIDPLLPLLNAQRRYGFVVVDHMAARYFELVEGELSLVGRKEFEIDHSQWKRREQGRVASHWLESYTVTAKSLPRFTRSGVHANIKDAFSFHAMRVFRPSGLKTLNNSTLAAFSLPILIAARVRRRPRQS